jgi:hypothetical protein
MRNCKKYTVIKIFSRRVGFEKSCLHSVMEVLVFGSYFWLKVFSVGIIMSMID